MGATWGAITVILHGRSLYSPPSVSPRLASRTARSSTARVVTVAGRCLSAACGDATRGRRRNSEPEDGRERDRDVVRARHDAHVAPRRARLRGNRPTYSGTPIRAAARARTPGGRSARRRDAAHLTPRIIRVQRRGDHLRAASRARASGRTSRASTSRASPVTTVDAWSSSDREGRARGARRERTARISRRRYDAVSRPSRRWMSAEPRAEACVTNTLDASPRIRHLSSSSSPRASRRLMYIFFPPPSPPPPFAPPRAHPPPHLPPPPSPPPPERASHRRRVVVLRRSEGELLLPLTPPPAAAHSSPSASRSCPYGPKYGSGSSGPRRFRSPLLLVPPRRRRACRSSRALPPSPAHPSRGPAGTADPLAEEEERSPVVRRSPPPLASARVRRHVVVRGDEQRLRAAVVFLASQIVANLREHPDAHGLALSSCAWRPCARGRAPTSTPAA